MRRTVWLRPVLVAATVALLAFPLNAATAAPGASPELAPGQSMGTAPSESEAAAVAAAAQARNALGYYYDEQEGQWVIVSSASGTPARPFGAEPAPADALSPAVRERVVAISADDIAAISTELLELAAATVVSDAAYGYAFDPRAGVVVVDGTLPEAALQPVLERFAGKVTYSEVANAGFTTRLADAAPHWGGAYIHDNVHACTSGWTVQKAGVKYLATAGHCFGLSASIFGFDGVPFGTIQWRAPFPPLDTELIGGSTYSGWIYGGDLNGTPRSVVGAADPLAGSVYWTSGVVSLETGNHTVTSLNATLCDEGICVGNLIRYTSGPMHGDSGGPFYWRYANGTVAARGTITGVSGTNGYATKWSVIANQFGVTIVLG